MAVIDASEDYYALLGVEPAADDDAIRRAWRALALEWHPDRAGTQTTATFQRIALAYTVLSDAGSRSRYDMKRGRQGMPSAGRPGTAPVGSEVSHA